MDFQALHSNFLQLNNLPNPSMHLDHLAIIDLPSARSGRYKLAQFFTQFGYKIVQEALIPERSNPFLWMRNYQYDKCDAHKTPPQIVLADFIIEDLSSAAQAIIKRLTLGIATEINASTLLSKPWDNITVAEYQLLKAENELLAWVVINGRIINHFGYSVYLDKKYTYLQQFLKQHYNENQLNQESGVVKGSKEMGIEQASTIGSVQIHHLIDGTVSSNGAFQEFVWRYPLVHNPYVYTDYFTDFLAGNASKIIESINYNE